MDVDNKARDGEIPSQRDPLGLQVSNVSRQHMIMAERLDLQGRLQEAQQRLIFEILDHMWREEAVTNLVQKACDLCEETEKVIRCILNKDNEQLYFSKDKMCDNCQA